MWKLLGIALGAGVTSAVLFAVTTTASPAAILLAYLAPLPVMIVGLSFTHLVGAAAALVGGGAIGVAMGPVAGALFLAALGLPAWHLARLAAARVRHPGGPPDAWYPVPSLLLNLAAVAAAPVLLAGAALVWRFGGYEEALKTLSGRLAALVSGEALPGDIAFADAVKLAPVAMAASSAVMLSVNLWLAARSVQISGLLRRPWPNLPDALRMPRPAVAVLAVLAASGFLPAAAGVAGRVAAAALSMAFVFEGLAAAHVLTRGLSGRPLVLAAIYLATVLLLPWPLLALALLGCIDCLVPGLRGRGMRIKITKLPRRRQ